VDRYGTLNDIFSGVKWQRCTVHFYRNIRRVVPKGKVRKVTTMLKAIHAQEDKDAAKDKINAVVDKSQIHWQSRSNRVN